MRENPRNVSLEDFESLIKYYGHIEEGGQHPKTTIGQHTVPYKRTNPINKPFVKLILAIIDDLNK